MENKKGRISILMVALIIMSIMVVAMAVYIAIEPKYTQEHKESDAGNEYNDIIQPDEQSKEVSKNENKNTYVKFDKTKLVGAKNLKIEIVKSLNVDSLVAEYVSVNYQILEDGNKVHWSKVIVNNAKDITGLDDKSGSIELDKEAVMVFSGAVGHMPPEKVCVLYADGTIAELKIESGKVIVEEEFSGIKNVVRFEQISTRYVEKNGEGGPGGRDIAVVEENGDIKILDFKNNTFFK